MRISLTSILFAVPLLTWAVVPTPNTVLDGAFVLNGGGSTIDATTLPSLTGYFMNSGTLDMSNVTLQNFSTTGGTGSGGGGGFGGTLFINSGVTVTLSNVNFIASTVTGGIGGSGDLGGILNNVVVPTSNGTPGVDGTDADPGTAYYNNGNGGNGFLGSPGGNGTQGFGGSGGKGGKGSDGDPTNLQLDQAIADQAELIKKTANNATTTADLTASNAALGALNTAFQVDNDADQTAQLAANATYSANPFMAGYSDAVSTIMTSFPFGTNELIFGEFDSQINLNADIISFVGTNISPYDAFLLTTSTALLAALQVESYEVFSLSGNGGNGAAGAPAGNGSFGFGGGRGGDGGAGGNAVPASDGIGGAGAPGGMGGIGGFGGGGGRGGDLGLSGDNGTTNPVNNGPALPSPTPGGISLFGGGVGSAGDAFQQFTSDEIGSGGGGFGLGGAIFVTIDGTLNINGPATFCGNNAEGGGSLNLGFGGVAAGTDLFMMTGSTVTLDPGAGNEIIFNGSIADDSVVSYFGFPVQTGTGASLSLTSGLAIFNGINTYSGETAISGGSVLQAIDGIGINPSSHIFLDGGTFQSSGTFTRYLGTNPNQVEFTATSANGFSAANGDLLVTLQCGAPLTWGQPFFLGVSQPFLFGSTSASGNVTFTNAINLAGVNETILATASTIPGVINEAILTGVLSNGSLTVGDLTHTGVVELSAANTYLGPTQVSGGTLVLSGSLQSTVVTINSGATMEDVNGGLANGTALTVNGTFILDSNDTINTLAGSGTIELNGGTLTVSSGSFSGPITATDSTSGITKVSGGLLTLSGASTYTGPTLVNGGTLLLTGSLQSQTINIAPGAILNDASGGLSSTSAVTVNGTLLIGATQTIGSLFGSGSVSINLASLTVGSGNFSGVISGGNPAFSFTKNTAGILTLSGANTYVGPTFVNAGTLILTGSLASTTVDIAAGATLEDVNGGLSSGSTVMVDGTLNLDTNQAIDVLNGAASGLVNLIGGTLTVNSGNYAGVIAGTNPAFGLTKVSGGTLTLSGNSTYNGPTLIDAGTLTLTGSLLSPTVNVALGATLNDNNGGLATGATLTNAGTVNLPVNNTIFALINSGTINGAGTLTALTYALNNGSIINANLGTGTLTSNGTVQLNGTSSANPIIIASGTLTLGSGGRLLLLPDVTANGTLVLGGNEAINGLFGTGGVDLGGNQLTVNNGNFSGVISGNAASQLIKTSPGVLTLSGANTYTGTTQINVGELILTGSLASLTVNVAAGATLDDNNSGLAPGATLTNNGLVNLPVSDTILALINSGTINGAGTLTALTYALNNGSIINANLGTGILTTFPGVETLTGTSAAGIVNVSAGSTFNLIGNQRLSALATVTVDGILNLPGFNQIINVLNGTGGNISANIFQVNSGGNFSGIINSNASFIAQGGILNLNNTTLNTSALVIGPGATLDFNGAAGVATTNTITLNNSSTFTISGGAVVNNSSDVTIPTNATVNVVTAGQFFTGGNIFLNSNANLTLDATGIVHAGTINTGLNSLITVPNSANLAYTLLTGFGTVDSLGGTFVNRVGETVTGFMIFLDNFTNLGTLSPGFSPGLITIGGNYVEGGHLALDILTITAITGYDQVRVGGTASLLPSSVFDVHMSSAVIVPGNFFQVIANSVGGPIPVSGILGAITLTVDGSVANPNIILFDQGTGRILISGIKPTPPGPPNPHNNPFFHLGCTSNQNRASKAIFTAALIEPTVINTSTVAGKLAQQIFQGSHCEFLPFYTPTYYGGMADYAFMGDRALAAQVWDRVSTFTSLPEQCCPKFSAFFGYINSEENKLHKTDLHRQDIYVGSDYSTCRGFSMGVAVSESRGKIHSHMGKSRVEGNTGIIYLRKNLGAYFMAFATASGSIQDNHLHRPTANGHVKARSQSKSITGNLGFQLKGWQVNCFSFAPRANVVYSHAHVDGFKEKGAIDALHDSGYNARFLTGELGLSTLCSTHLWSRPLDIEATIGIEQPFKYHRDKMDMYVISSPDIAYSVFLPNAAKTRLSGGLNFGYNLFKAVTLYGGYEVITGGDWNHVASAGIRICL